MPAPVKAITWRAARSISWHRMGGETWYKWPFMDPGCMTFLSSPTCSLNKQSCNHVSFCEWLLATINHPFFRCKMVQIYGQLKFKEMFLGASEGPSYQRCFWKWNPSERSVRHGVKETHGRLCWETTICVKKQADMHLVEESSHKTISTLNRLEGHWLEVSNCSAPFNFKCLFPKDPCTVWYIYLHLP